MTNEVQTANLDVISEKDQFSEDISPGYALCYGNTQASTEVDCLLSLGTSSP